MKKTFFKTTKKLLKCLAWTSGVITVLLLMMLLSLRLPSVQQWLSRRVTDALSGKLKTKVSVTGLYISGLNDITLENLYVEDRQQDTMLFIHKLELGVSDYRLDTFYLKLDDVVVEDADFYLRRYEQDSLLNIRFLLDAFAGDSTEASDWSLQCASLVLANTRFIYDDRHQEPIDTAFDPAHIDARINAAFAQIVLSGDSMGASIDNISIRDEKGFDLKKMSGAFYSMKGATGIRHLSLRFGHSSLSGYCSLLHRDYGDFTSMMDSIEWRLVLDTATMYPCDLADFMPSLHALNSPVALSGRMTGAIADMHLRQIHLGVPGRISLSANADISGLPDIETSFIMIDVKELVAEHHALDSIPLPPFSEHKYFNTPEILNRMGQLVLSGELTGFINDFVAYTRIQSDAGILKTDLNMKKDTGDQWKMSGTLATGGLDAGRILDNGELGKLSLVSNVTGILNGSKTAVAFDAKVDDLSFRAYDYKNLLIDGNYNSGQLSASLESTDPVARINGNTVLDFSTDTVLLAARANIAYLDLQATGILPNDSMTFSGVVRINTVGMDLDDNTASISVDSLMCQRGKKRLKSNFIHIEIGGSTGNRSVTVYSDIAEARLKGRYAVNELGIAFKSILSNPFPTFYKSDNEIDNGYDFNVTINGKQKFEEAARLLIPGMDSIKGFSASFGMQSAEKHSELEVQSSRIVYNGMMADSAAMGVSVKGGQLVCNGGIGFFRINDSLWVGNLSIKGGMQQDTGRLQLRWDNKTRNIMQGHINAQIVVDSTSTTAISLYKSSLVLADSLWQIGSPRPLLLDSDGVKIKDLRFSKGRERLVINADLKHRANDLFKLELIHIDLNNLNHFIPSISVQLNGRAEGYLKLINPYGTPLLSAGLNLKQIRVDGKLVGDGKLQASYDDESDRVRFTGGLKSRNLNIFNVKGHYYPSQKADNLAANVRFKQLPLTVLQPVLKDYLDTLDGIATGDLKITGTPEHPVIKGALDLGPSRFFVDYTRCGYTTPGAHITVDDDLIAFDQISLFDRYHQEAKLNGTILHNNFSRFNFDMSAEMTDFQCLDTHPEDNPDYYGDARLTGMANISGFAENLTIEAVLKTMKNTSFFIPLDNPEEVGEYSYITFMSSDTAIARMNKHNTVDLSGIQMNLEMEITPDADVEIIFDETVGDVIRGNANGNLRLEINTSGDFNMFGTLGIVKGDYLFTLENIINKRFAVEPGSTIAWNGSPYNAELNLDAVYKLKAPTYDITGDTSREGHRRIPVDVHLLMTRAMLSPDIAFDIQLPTAGENTKRAVESALTNEQEVNKQVFSLLMLNRFMPPPGISSTQESRTGLGGTTSSELLSNQLSNWLSGISKQVDIGVNYRPGDDVNSDELEVALSTQLFNDRLEIETNVGISDENKSTGNSSLAGDFRVEYKITDDGRLRAVAYNTSNDETVLTSTSNARYTQGAGFSYKQDFNTWKEFFDGIRHVSVIRKKDNRQNKDD